ncbi:hypothetical protein CHU98_g1815 [Xylaria longipes]|nr:hypothetical protein CHU98_g1815 [Xylaria longipes]
MVVASFLALELICVVARATLCEEVELLAFPITDIQILSENSESFTKGFQTMPTLLLANSLIFHKNVDAESQPSEPTIDNPPPLSSTRTTAAISHRSSIPHLPVARHPYGH